MKENLSPAGYLVLLESEKARTLNPYRQAFGPYFGVDRMPPFVSPELAIREPLGEPPVEDPKLLEALREWFDARPDQTAFFATLTKASRLCMTLQSSDYPLEITYCQLAWEEGEEERLRAYANVESQTSSTSLTYGFDVSWPTCNHSAILQPGVVRDSLCWREKLNRWGLLSSYADAKQLRQEYLAVYPYPPFDIYLIHKVEINIAPLVSRTKF